MSLIESLKNDPTGPWASAQDALRKMEAEQARAYAGGAWQEVEDAARLSVADVLAKAD